MTKRPPSKARRRAATLGFMLAVTVAAISVVSALRLATAGIVARNRSLYLKRAVLEAAGLDVPRDAAGTLSLFARTVRPVPEPDRAAYYHVRGGNPRPGAPRGVALVFPARARGLWGDIMAVVGLGADLNTFTGVTFLDHSETPGLGARIDEAWFKKQFCGKSGRLSMVPEGTPEEAEHQFDAITGATITSRGVCDMMNMVLTNAPVLLDRHRG